MYPPLTPEEEAYFYQKEFENYMADRSGQRAWRSPEDHVIANQGNVLRRWPFLAPYAKDGMDALEIGCSSGFMLDKLREEGLHCTGVEPSGVFSSFVASKGFQVYSSLEELKTSTSKRFDLIVHFFVLEHITDPFSFFAKQLNLLKPGGIIIAEIPSATDPLTSLYRISAFEKFYWSVAHHYYYTKKSIQYVMDKLALRYELIPEQRYDLSNHIVWMCDGKPGGQGRYDDVFSPELISRYKQDLKNKWLCDTMFLVIRT